MSCNDTNPPCPCTPYVSTGCLDTYDTDCVKYSKDAIACLQIEKGDTLTDILGHLQDVVCALTPSQWEDYDYGCLDNYTTQQEFVEGISDILCQVLGSQVSGSITSLSTISSTLTTHTSQITTLTTHTTLDCFETISGLAGPTASLTVMIAALQQAVCDHETDIAALTALGAIALTANDSATIDFTTSGTGNHTLTGSVKLSAVANNALTAQVDGVHVLSPVITASDSSTIDFTASGTHSHTITGAVKISSDANNILVAHSDGLYVPDASIAETDVTANDSSSIDFTTSGTNNHTITASVKIDPNVNNIISITGSGLYADGSSFALSNNSVTDSILRDSSGFSVVGRAATGTGDPGDIIAAADTVLRRSGSGNLGFGTLVTNNIGDDQVTFAKTQNISSQRILGRLTAGTGDIESLLIGNRIDTSGGTLNILGRTLIGITKFTASGTWTKPTGCTAVIVDVVGGGGGGGGATSNAGEAAAGGGGGSAFYDRCFITSGLGATVAVTVGGGGAGGLSTGANGSDGSTSSFGALVSVHGGGGGTGMTSGTTNAIAQGGSLGTSITTSGTRINFAQSTGEAGIRFSGTLSLQGAGGKSISNSQSRANQGLSFPGDAGIGHGGGGQGANALNGDDFAGGEGCPGVVIVYEYT
jgi:hypothetical protein